MDEPLEPASTAASWQQLLEQGRLAEALRRYQETEAPQANVVEAFRLLTQLQDALRERNFERARRRLEDLEPQAPLFDYQALSVQLTQLEVASQALGPHTPERALEQLEPVHQPLFQAEVQTLRGTGLIFMNDSEGAAAAFHRALEFDPKHYRALTNLGNLSLEAGEVDTAISYYQQALAVNAEFANAHHNLGVAYRRKGQIGKSVRSLRKAQGASQRKLREEAQQTMKRGLSGSLQRYGRWLLYAVLAGILYFVLRAQGVI